MADLRNTSVYFFVRVFGTGLVLLLLAGCSSGPLDTRSVAEVGHFDPHTHLSGVLPWQAYVNLPVYISKLEGGQTGVTTADKRRFYQWLAGVWYPEHKAQFDDQPFSSTMRYGLGARATLALYPPRPNRSPEVLDDILERIFTATPFTEFDSAYAFHGPAYAWLSRTYYGGDARAANEALCTAQVLTLARAHITRSEQSVSFIGGWRFDDEGYSPLLHTILCAARKPRELSSTFKRLGEARPVVRIILMTHTDQLGQNVAGDAYRTFEGTGRCHWRPLPAGLGLGPEQMYRALIGEDRRGRRIVPPTQRKAFFDTLAGIDTAAPEMTCFSAAGMNYYQNLIDAVYRAAKARRAMGWQGKLLVHTHVGEGFTTYYARRPPRKPWRFDSVFARIPVLDGNVVTNTRVPHENITKLLGAVAAVRSARPDLDAYVVIRFGHVTHVDLAQAREMARLHVEADVNPDSNLATGSWSFAEMPGGNRMADRAATAAADPATNFVLNDLPGFLIPDPEDERTVAGVFGTYPLKYLLMAHVRVMPGTDGTGVEHGSLSREYALTGSLIRYWKTNDPAFVQAAGNVGMQTLLENAARHLQDMAGSERH